MIVKPNEWFYIKYQIVKLTSALLSNDTHLDRHTHFSISFSQESLGCLINYSLDCLGHLTKMATTPIYGKTKFVPL